MIGRKVQKADGRPKEGKNHKARENKRSSKGQGTEIETESATKQQGCPGPAVQLLGVEEACCAVRRHTEDAASGDL